MSGYCQFNKHSSSSFVDLDMLCYSQLVSALVRVLPQPSSEHPEHGRERSGSSRQGAAAAPDRLRHHLTGNSSCTHSGGVGGTSRYTGCPGTAASQFHIQVTACLQVYTFYASLSVTALCVAPAGDLILRGFNSR